MVVVVVMMMMMMMIVDGHGMKLLLLTAEWQSWYLIVASERHVIVFSQLFSRCDVAVWLCDGELGCAVQLEICWLYWLTGSTAYFDVIVDGKVQVTFTTYLSAVFKFCCSTKYLDVYIGDSDSDSASVIVMFLPHDALHKYRLCHHKMSVCLSVTHHCCIEMAKHIIKRSLLGSHIFLVFSSTCDSNIPTWLVANAVSRFISETRDTLCQTRSLSNATFSYLIMWRSTSWKSAAVYKISWKSYDFSLRYGDILIFKMAAVRHLRIVLPPYETTHEVCYWPQLPVKFHVNLIQRSEDMTIWIFFTFLAWSDYSGPKMEVLGDFGPINVNIHHRDPQKAHPCVNPHLLGYQL